MPLSPDDPGLADWLALWRAPGIGPRAFSLLNAHFDDARAARRASAQALQYLGLSTRQVNAIQATSPDDARADLDWLAEAQHALLTLGHPDYPPLLAELPDAPPFLFIAGEPRLLLTRQLAIVGSRHPTPTGAEHAREFAQHLASAGLTITSGLALGVDAAAHQGALAAPGLTIAVAATGLDRVYPARNRALAHEIAEQGALVSEFPIGSGPRAEHFPRRNRIISGLSLGTLVVEAALKSGSLITARLAAEQGREVFAIPGSIHNPLARGCHRLIREGAKLVETAQDILEELGLPVAPEAARPSSPAAPETTAPLDPDYRHLLDNLGYDPTPVDTLVERTGLTAEAVSSMLLLLELRNEVASLDGGRYQRITPRD